MSSLWQKLKSSALLAGVLDIRNVLKGRGYRTVAVPRMRNMIWDIMDEARRKNTMHLSFDADAVGMNVQIAKYSAALGAPVSITTYLTKVLADTVADDTSMQAYLSSRKKFILFDDVDVSVMIERKVDGARLPVPFVLRRANQKSLVEIDAALKQAKRKPLHVGSGPVSALESQFFSLPRFIRKFFWFFIRRDPRLFKEIAGTVALTSLPWHVDGRGIGWGISPMTLTLVVGATSKQVKLVDGLAVEHEVLQLHIEADHDVIDAAPMARFVVRFKARLVGGLGEVPLPNPAAASNA